MLHFNINMHILCTVLFTFPKELKRKILLIDDNFLYCCDLKGDNVKRFSMLVPFWGQWFIVRSKRLCGDLQTVVTTTKLLLIKCLPTTAYLFLLPSSRLALLHPTYCCSYKIHSIIKEKRH